jgi:hypothetical protein
MLLPVFKNLIEEFLLEPIPLGPSDDESPNFIVKDDKYREWKSAGPGLTPKLCAIIH